MKTSLSKGSLWILIAMLLTACETPVTHTHDWGAWTRTSSTCTTAGIDKRVCSLDPSHIETRAVAIDPTAHDWGEWTGTVTCTEAGTGTRVCSHNEAHTETKELAALGHNYIWSVTTAPTCTTTGVENGTCTRVNTHTTTRSAAIDPNAHNWSEWRETTVSCTEKGISTRVCFRNGTHTETKELPALGHDYVWSVTTAPTCVLVGEEEGTCTHNSLHITTRVAAINPDAHDWGNWAQITAPTVTTDGAEAATCSHDNSHEKTRPIYATGTAGLAFELISGGANDGTYRVRKGSVTSGVVYIPVWWRGNSTNYENYKPVTEIGSASDGWDSYSSDNRGGAFSGLTITAVHIPATVTTIGSYAFSTSYDDPMALATVTFAEGSQLETIGHGAFEYRRNLTGITIPDGVTTISTDAFSYCTSLTSITIPASVITIGYGAFYNCTGLTSITISDGVTTIGGTAFYGCTGLTEITLPASVTIIGNHAFYRCTGLTGITIPDSITTIGSSAFSGCTGLTSITIPDSITTIGNSAFSGCTGLISITIPDSVTAINYSTFSGCTGLTSITIPDSITTIGSSAFSGCTGLTSITIPDSVTSIASGAFNSTAWFNNQPDGLVYAGKVLYIYKGTMPANTVINNIRADTIAIADGVFSSGGIRTSLTGIIIPAGVTTIGGAAFAYCSGLTSIIIPTSVTSVGSGAFYSWTAAQTIYVQGHANQMSADYAWESWRSQCNATIVYQGN